MERIDSAHVACSARHANQSRSPFHIAPSQGMGRRQALIAALRREDAAVKDAKRLEGELEGMRGLLKVRR